MKLDLLEERIIYHLMLQSGPITIAKLGDLCGVSANSIRSRIPYLNRKIKDEDLHITMKRSVGCELHKLSEEKAENERLHDLRFDLNRNNFISRTDRIDIIIRRLLCTEGYFPIQSACDMLFYSYSELHRDIASANSYLEKFHLEIATKRSKGLYIKGNEMNKRICLAFQHKRFRYLDDHQKDNEPWFASIFANSLRIDTTRQAFNEILSEHPGYAYSHLNFPKINNMLYIMRARKNYASKISFPEDVMTYIREREAYEIAEKILNRLGEKISLVPVEEDRICLAAVLECYRSVRTIDDLKGMRGFERFYDETRLILDELSEKIFGTLSYRNKESLDYFTCSLYTAFVHNFFDLPLDEEAIYPLQQNFAVSADFAVALYHIMKDRYGIVLSVSLLKYMTYTLRTSMRDLIRQAGDLNLLVYSIYGVEYARNIAINLQRVYSEDFSHIDFIESLPALHSEVSRRYDLLLTDNSSKNLKDIDLSLQDLPILWLPISNFPERFHELDDWLFQQKNTVLEDMLKGRIIQGSFKTIHAVYKAFYDLLKNDLQMKENEFIELCEKREAIFPSERENRTACIALDRHADCGDLIAILINKKPVSWYGSAKIQFFVFYNCSLNDHHNRKAVLDFLKMFIRKAPGALSSLSDKNGGKVIASIMKEDD